MIADIDYSRQSPIRDGFPQTTDSAPFYSSSDCYCGSPYKIRNSHDRPPICVVKYGYPLGHIPDHPCSQCGERAWVMNWDTERVVCGWCHSRGEHIDEVRTPFAEFPSTVDTILKGLESPEDNPAGL